MTSRIFKTIALFYLRDALSSEPHTNVSAPHMAWLVNDPDYFRAMNKTGVMLDVRNNSANMTEFIQLSDSLLAKLGRGTDGEVVDAIEHYFWGMRDGIAIELGALDGRARSMTYAYEKDLNWRRILIEGNPGFRVSMKGDSPLSFSANAAICSTHSTVHFVGNENVGGIIEFMHGDFLKSWHKDIYNACSPPGNTSALNMTKLPNREDVQPIECIPMSTVLKKAQVKHVNLFILDVEGAEYEVLKTINWAHVKFDVLCIETEKKFRPSGYAAMITAYLGERGYVNSTQQQGRNS